MTTRGRASSSRGSEPDPEPIPEWKRQSVDRSLTAARARAQDRTDRFVAAGIALITRTGDTGFTVQDVVDEARMSIRTFYSFFAGKDDLLLAIHETILVSEVVPRLRAGCDAQPDPVAKIRAYIDTLFDLSENPAPSTRAFVVQQHRLAETRPEDLDLAMAPQVDLLVELVEGAADAGRVREGLDVEPTARLLHHLVHGIVQDRVLGSKQTGLLSADALWVFTAAAIGATTTSRRASRRS